MKLRTSDGMIFTVEDHLVEKWKMVQMMVEDCVGADDMIVPLNNVTAHTLVNVLRYAHEGVLPDTGYPELLEMARACDYIIYEEGLDAACKRVAEIFGQIPEWKKKYEITQALGLF